MYIGYLVKRFQLKALCIFFILTCVTVLAGFVSQDSKFTSHPKEDVGTSTVLITGANRGLGLEFARQYHEAGYNVIATARKPDAAEELNAIGVQVEQLDVADSDSVASLAKRLGDSPIDILINNAGISLTSYNAKLEEIKIDDVRRVIEVNTLGPMRVTQALLKNMREGDEKIIVSITSGLGSITNNKSGSVYGYRESKAALNMFNRSLANELKAEGFKCIVMSPGWVKTDMGGPNAQLTPEESIAGMRIVIEGLTMEDSGEFHRYNGKRMPW